MEDNTSDIRDRIRTVMNKVGKNSITFSEEIGIQQSTLSHIINGRNRPSLDVIMKIHQRYPEVSFDWLINGTKDISSDTGNVEMGQEVVMNRAANSLDDGIANPNGGTRTYIGTASPASPSSSEPFVVGTSKPRTGMSDLFDQNNVSGVSSNPIPANPATPSKIMQQGMQASPLKEVIKYIEKPAKHVTEIIIYYDDNTWEKFTCEKQK